MRREGPRTEVQLSVPAAYAAALERQGDSPPSPQTVMGLIDTGASISTVTEEVAAALGLSPTGTIQLGGVGGSSQRPIYAASFGLPEYGVVIDPIEIASVPIPFADFQVLIGRDVLLALHFLYQGPLGQFDVSQKGAPAEGPAANGIAGIPTPYFVGGAALLGIAAIAAFA